MKNQIFLLLKEQLNPFNNNRLSSSEKSRAKEMRFLSFERARRRWKSRKTKTSTPKNPTPPSDFSGDSEVQGLGKLVFLVVWECGKACKGYFLGFAGLARGRNGTFFGVCTSCKGSEWCIFGVCRACKWSERSIFGVCRACKWRKRGIFCCFTVCKPPARVLFDRFTGCKLLTSVLFDRFTGCKLLTRVLFHSLHGMQTPSKGPFPLFAWYANSQRGGFFQERRKLQLGK